MAGGFWYLRAQGCASGPRFQLQWGPKCLWTAIRQPSGRAADGGLCLDAGAGRTSSVLRWLRGLATGSAGHPCAFPQQRVRWARALYDFEALEDDELGFHCGEVLEVLDSSNPSWWTGRLHNKLGLFPANYVAPMIR